MQVVASFFPVDLPMQWSLHRDRGAPELGTQPLALLGPQGKLGTQQDYANSVRDGSLSDYNIFKKSQTPFMRVE